jgi:hypothetical protein
MNSLITSSLRGTWSHMHQLGQTSHHDHWHGVAWTEQMGSALMMRGGYKGTSPYEAGPMSAQPQAYC